MQVQEPAAEFKTLPDAQELSPSTLLKTVESFKDKTVLVTGAGAGLGRGFALRAAAHGANLVVCDLNDEALQETIALVQAKGGRVVGQVCDVVSFEQQASVFDLGVKEFQHIDIVFPSAGVTEISQFALGAKFKDGKLQPPNLKTLEVNLTGHLYTISLALNYLKRNPSIDKSLIVMGSISGFYAIPRGTCYSASKHALLGAARSLIGECKSNQIRISYVAPFFTDTHIIDTARPLLVGVEICTVEEVVNALSFAATDPDAFGKAIYVTPSSCITFNMARTAQSIAHLEKRVKSLVQLERTIRDLVKLIGGLKLSLVLGVPVLLLGWWWRRA